jgi:hypothetical protein
MPSKSKAQVRHEARQRTARGGHQRRGQLHWTRCGIALMHLYLAHMARGLQRERNGTRRSCLGGCLVRLPPHFTALRGLHVRAIHAHTHAHMTQRQRQRDRDAGAVILTQRHRGPHIQTPHQQADTHTDLVPQGVVRPVPAARYHHVHLLLNVHTRRALGCKLARLSFSQ